MSAATGPELPQPPPAAVVRRYRRALWAYPPGARRDEILDTLLLAAADEGRTRPAAGQTVHLSCAGARARLGRPGGTAVVVVAVVVSVVVGLYTAAAASVLAWHVAGPPLPNTAQLTELRDLVTPAGTAATGYSTSSVWTGSELFVSTNEGVWFATAGYLAYRYVASDDLAGYSRALRERLESAGWEIREQRIDGETRTSSGLVTEARLTLIAERGAWRLEVRTDAGPFGAAPSDADAVSVTVDRRSPGPVRAATVAGIIPGLLIGWVLTGWVSRRTERSRGASVTTAALTAMTLFVVFPNAVLAGRALAAEVWRGEPEPFWHYLIYDYEAGFMTVLATVGVLAVLVTAAWAPRRRART